MTRLKNILLNLILIQALIIVTVSAQNYTDNDIKASYIEKFTHYIEWPDNYLSEDLNEPILISVYGESNFYDVLKTSLVSKEILGRPVQINQIYSIKNLSNCHILFIPECGKRKLEEILRFTENKPILTISDSKNYAALGVLINFVIVQNKVRFEINTSSVKDSGLEFDFKLLKIAETF